MSSSHSDLNKINKDLQIVTGNGRALTGSRFNSVNTSMNETHALLPQVDPVASFELVELFYGNNTSEVAQNSHNQQNLSTRSNPPLQDPMCSEKRNESTSESFKCETCNRVFKEVSHFYKHKRGALCRKSALKLARKNKKKVTKKKDNTEKKNQVSTVCFKPYQCTICGAKFFDKVNVELHLERTHGVQQPMWREVTKSGGFACSDCNLWFTDKSQLRQHQTQHESPPVQVEANQPSSTQFYSQPIQHLQTFPPNLHPAYHQMPPVSNPPFHQLAPTHSNPHLPPFMVTSTPLSSAVSVPPSFICSPNVNSSMSAPSESSTATPTSDSMKMIKNSSMKHAKTAPSNVCGDCGCRFVDAMNLELHVQRKHPGSLVAERVELNGGLMLYRTNNSNNNLDLSLHEKRSNNFYECILCCHKESDLPSITNHLQTHHDTTQAHFINLVDLSESRKKQSVKAPKHTSPPNLTEPTKEIPTEQKCSSCFKSFPTKVELVRHRVKEKTIFCGICSFASCSNAQVASHIYSSHNEEVTESPDADNLSSPNTSADLSEECLSCDTESFTDKEQTTPSKDADDDSSKLTCCMCEFYATSGVALAEHLQSHDSFSVKCGKCDETSDNFVAINEHINSHHSNEVVRVTLSMRNSATPFVYMFLITPHKKFPAASSTPKKKTNKNASDEDAFYACSHCGAFLNGLQRLETHSQKGCSSDPHENKITALSTMKNTVEFRCQECGFWRIQSSSVIDHIKSVHFSANMIHSQNMGAMEVISTTIRVITPLSSLVSS